MKVTDDELKTLMQRRTAPAAVEPDLCLSEEILRRAAAKDLSRDERESVALHLRTCSDCARSYQVAHAARIWISATDGPLADFLSNVVASEQGSAPIPFPPSRAFGPLSRRSHSTVLPLALAASLLGLAVLAGWIVLLNRNHSREIVTLNDKLAEQAQALNELREPVDQNSKSPQPPLRQPAVSTDPNEEEHRVAALERDLAEMSKPQLNVPIADLEPGITRGNSGRPGTVVTVPRSAQLFTLILHTSSGEPAPEYAVSISDAASRSVWRGRGLRRGSDGSLTLALSRRLFSPGRYLIELYDVRKSGTQPAEQYVLELRYE